MKMRSKVRLLGMSMRWVPQGEKGASTSAQRPHTLCVRFKGGPVHAPKYHPQHVATIEQADLPVWFKRRLLGAMNHPSVIRYPLYLYLTEAERSELSL
jgi:hypothetical protein